MKGAVGDGSHGIGVNCTKCVVCSDLVVLLVLVMKIIMIDLLRLGKDLIRWL